jgi:TolB-like protein
VINDAQAPAVAAISDKSIAVLPFVDMSKKKDQEYFRRARGLSNSAHHSEHRRIRGVAQVRYRTDEGFRICYT